MDEGAYLISCFLGIAAALAVFFPLGAKRRALIPTFAWWLFLIVGSVTLIYGMNHSTAPSLATRITVVGKTYDFVNHPQGRDSYNSFVLVPDGGRPVNIETEMGIPSWAAPEIFNGRIFRVVYLEEQSVRARKNEAIEIEILSGAHAGYHNSLDARPLGKWLAVPIGAALGVFGFCGIRFKNDDSMPAVSNDPFKNTTSLFSS